ncbi:hypothetical protein TeGR_g9682 [Tetraparma gracilis]|uniref:Uncharacterized protein n=1 Tax=Tetraparma gracilis TaxID=2962635 RepID=A0ABQ6N321_9STRA|nr:hypothetical protein TeGR_g9682 [Tetraparma gracilis]
MLPSASAAAWPLFFLLTLSCILLFSSYIVVHFLSRDASSWENEVTFFYLAPPAARAGIHAHWVAGTVIMLLIPLQLLRSVRRSVPCLHRASGRVILLSSLPLCGGGFAYIFSRGTTGGPSMSASFTLYGGLVLFAAFKTFRSAVPLRSDKSDSLVESHRRWASRLATLLLGSGLFRLMVALGLLVVLPDYVYDRDEDLGAVKKLLNVVAWLYYPLPLAATELYLRRTKPAPAPVTRRESRVPILLRSSIPGLDSL